MLHTKFHQISPVVPGKKIFKVCDQHYVDEFSFPCTYKLTFKIWLKKAQWLLIKHVLSFICK